MSGETSVIRRAEQECTPRRVIFPWSSRQPCGGSPRWRFSVGDEGLAALVAPPPLVAGALPPPTGVLPKLQTLDLRSTRVNDAGCAGLAAALDSGALPALARVSILSRKSLPAPQRKRLPLACRRHSKGLCVYIHAHIFSADCAASQAPSSSQPPSTSFLFVVVVVVGLLFLFVVVVVGLCCRPWA